MLYIGIYKTLIRLKSAFTTERSKFLNPLRVATCQVYFVSNPSHKSIPLYVM